MLQHHYLPTLVDDRRHAREATANRRRLVRSRHAGLRFHRRPALTLIASAVRTTAEAAGPRAA